MGKVAFFNKANHLDIGEQPSWSAVAMPEEEETAAVADWSPYFGGVQSPPFRRLVPAALLPPVDEDVPDNEDDDISEDEGGGRIQRSLDSLQALADSLTSIGQVQRGQVRHVVFLYFVLHSLKRWMGFVD
jgi:hypothetical protein